VAIYEGNGKIIEAATDKRSSGHVMRSDIDSYLHGPELIEIIRPSYKTPMVFRDRLGLYFQYFR
jgi:hypothetical protein